MASLRGTEGQTRPAACRDWPRWTREAWPRFVPPVATACQASRTAWRRSIVVRHDDYDELQS